MWTKLVLIFLIFTNITTFASPTNERRNLISVNTNNINSLSRYEVDFIRKSAFEAIFASKVFEISMIEGGVEFPSGESHFEMILNTKEVAGKKYDIEFKIIEKPSGEIINMVTRKKIPRERVQVVARGMLYKVIFEEYFNEEENILIEPKISPKLENKINQRANRRVGKRGENKPVEPKERIEGENVQGVTEEAEELKGKPKEEPKAEPEEEKSSRKKRTTRNNKSLTQKFSAPNIDLRRNAFIRRKEPLKLTLIKRFNYHLAYESEASTASSIVTTEGALNTTTSTQRVAATFIGNFKVDEWEKHFQIGGTFSKLLSENEYGLSPRMSLFANYNLDLFAESVFVCLCLEYETFSFVSLAEQGGGLQAFNNTAVWGGVGLNLYLEFFNIRANIFGSLKKVFVGSSDLTTLDEKTSIDGNKIQLAVRTNLYKNLGLGFAYEQSTFSSLSDSDFDTTHEMVSTILSYDL